MNTDNFKNIVESLIFASEDEITSKQLRDILVAFNIKVDSRSIEQAIDDLNEDYKRNLSSFEIIKVAGGFQFSSRKEYGVYVGKLFDEKQKKRLSQSSIETLAIVAYKQPITRSEIEFIRGVNVDYIINSLLERDLVTITGRATTPGKPILYGTTPTFLKVLGLNSLEDLPKLKEINDILKNEKIEGITEADIDLFNSINVENIEGKSKGTANEQKLIEFNENNSEPDTLNNNDNPGMDNNNENSGDPEHLKPEIEIPEGTMTDKGTDSESNDEKSGDTDISEEPDIEKPEEVDPEVKIPVENINENDTENNMRNDLDDEIKSSIVFDKDAFNDFNEKGKDA
ncbi:hypothetical protein BH10BAC5_BH10BAC5_02060 [soil metagenome]